MSAADITKCQTPSKRRKDCSSVRQSKIPGNSRGNLKTAGPDTDSLYVLQYESREIAVCGATVINFFCLGVWRYDPFVYRLRSASVA